MARNKIVYTHTASAPKRTSTPSSSSSGTSGRVPANSYGNGTKYVGGTTMRGSDGSTYNVGAGDFTSPSGKVSDVGSDGSVTTVSSRDKSQNGNTYYNNGNYTSGNSNGGLTTQSEYLSKMQAAADAAAEAQRAKTSQAVSALEGNRSTIEQNAEEAARQAYISKMLTQKNLAQQLKATGYSGGLSDTAVLRMNTDYENSRDKIMRQKMGALNDLNSQISQVRASGNISAAQSESEWQQKLAELQYNLQKEAAAQQLQQQQMAAASAAKTSSGNSTTTPNKPRLTYAQTLEQINAGNGSNVVMEAADYYGLTPKNGGISSNQNGFVKEVAGTLNDFRSATAGINYLNSLLQLGDITESEYRLLQQQMYSNLG